MQEAMDSFINTLLSSSWSDINESANRLWGEAIASQTDCFLADSMSVVAHENSSSIFSDISLNYGIGEGHYPAGTQSQQPSHNSKPSHCIETSESSFSILDTCNSTGYGVELNFPHSALTISCSLESHGEPPTFGQSMLEANPVSSVPTIWPSSYSCLSSSTGQQKKGNLNFQFMTNGADLLRKSQNELSSNLLTFASGQQMKIISANSPPYNQGTTEATNLQLPFNSGMHTNPQFQSEGTCFNYQLSHSSCSHQQMTRTNAVGCNVAAKPRARRGQATDPHSIAERLRREKIAERIKNLQELVPNFNKTDKASMLDEIIDYVKFLQLQVKVLSMSRLSAGGAVLPFITDAQAVVDIGTLHLSAINQGVNILESQDNLAFEQVVVKLMESSVTTAMQYLQNKGLCLMPIEIATAISNKDSTASTPLDQRKEDLVERDDPGDEANHSIGLNYKA